MEVSATPVVLDKQLKEEPEKRQRQSLIQILLSVVAMEASSSKLEDSPYVPKSRGVWKTQGPTRRGRHLKADRVKENIPPSETTVLTW